MVLHGSNFVQIISFERRLVCHEGLESHTKTSLGTAFRSQRFRFVLRHHSQRQHGQHFISVSSFVVTEPSDTKRNQQAVSHQLQKLFAKSKNLAKALPPRGAFYEFESQIAVIVRTSFVPIFVEQRGGPFHKTGIDSQIESSCDIYKR